MTIKNGKMMMKFTVLLLLTIQAKLFDLMKTKENGTVREKR